MRCVGSLLAVLVLAAVAGCGDDASTRPRARGVRTLEEALRVEHGGVTLRDLLGRIDKSFRGTGDAVLAAYAELGTQAPAWLARAVEAGVPEDPMLGLRVLEVSREIAREATPTLERWLNDRAPERGAFRARVACLLLEVAADHPKAQSAFREALRSDDSESFERAMLGLGFLGAHGMQFAADLLDAAEAPPGEFWAANIVSYLDQFGPVAAGLREQLDRVRKEAGRTHDDPSEVIPRGR